MGESQFSETAFSLTEKRVFCEKPIEQIFFFNVRPLNFTYNSVLEPQVQLTV